MGTGEIEVAVNKMLSRATLDVIGEGMLLGSALHMPARCSH